MVLILGNVHGVIHTIITCLRRRHRRCPKLAPEQGPLVLLNSLLLAIDAHQKVIIPHISSTSIPSIPH